MNRLFVLAAVVAVGCTPKPPLTRELFSVEFVNCFDNHYLIGELTQAKQIAEDSKASYDIADRGTISNYMAWKDGPERARVDQLESIITSDCQQQILNKYGR